MFMYLQAFLHFFCGNYLLLTLFWNKRIFWISMWNFVAILFVILVISAFDYGHFLPLPYFRMWEFSAYLFAFASSFIVFYMSGIAHFCGNFQTPKFVSAEAFYLFSCLPVTAEKYFWQKGMWEWGSYCDQTKQVL